MADTPDLDLKLPDGTEFKGNLQDAVSSLPGSMQPDLQRIGADMAQRNPTTLPSVDNNQVVQKMNDYYANVDQDRQKQQGMLDKDLLQNQQERHVATEELKHTLQQGPQHAAKPEVPKLQPDQITPVFGALMVMAALSGMGARNHATGALNAMNGVMEGSHTGNKELYDRSMKEFEEKSRQAVEAQRGMVDEWNSKIKVGELTRSDLEDEARNFHLKYPQLKIDDAIMQGQPSHMFQVMDAAQKNIQHVEDANAKFVAAHTSEVSDDDLRFIARQVIADPSAKTLVGSYDRVTKQRLAHLYVDEANKAGKSPEQIVAGQKLIAAEAGAAKQAENRSVAVSRLEGSIDALGPMLKELAEKGLPGGVKVVNQPINWLRTHLSDTDLTNLQILTTEIPTQYMEAMTMPGSNAQMHEGARTAGTILMNENMSYGQLMGAYDTMTKILHQNGEVLKKIAKEETDKIADGGSSLKPQPTDQDRAWAKAHPEDAEKFKAHFGIDP